MPRRQLSAEYLSRRRWTVADARVALSAQRSSGLSVAAFAAREGLDAQRLYFWRRRVETEVAAAETSPAFIELRPRGSELVEIVLRSGRVLRVAETVDPAALVRLVAALDQTEPC